MSLPLNTTCDALNKEWISNNSATSLINEWMNCISGDNPIRKDPEWQKLSDRETDNKMDSYCCNLVMQCNNPNKWLHDNKINATCQLEKKPDEPHFGDIQLSSLHGNKIINTLKNGVY